MTKNVFVLSASMVALASSPAFAQGEGAASIDSHEIIVTAQKRAERIQDVPLAITAVSGDAIAARGFGNLAQITQLSPNVNMNEGIVSTTMITPFIRGIGTGDAAPENDMPVAISIDGVYLASVFGSLVDAFDIQQVEILRGPQGTLQGRNAPGGAVNITTRRPGDEWTIRGLAEYGRFSDVKVAASMDGPLIEDKLGVKLAGNYRKSDGYTKGLDIAGNPTGREFGGRDVLSFRGGLQITPTDTLNIWLAGDYMLDKSPPTAFRDANDGKSYPRPEYADELNTLACTIFSWCTPARRYTTHQSWLGDSKAKIWGLTSNIDLDAGPVTLTSVSGYRKIVDNYVLDVDATPFPLLEAMKGTGPKRSGTVQKTFSQEFRIASNDGGSLSFNDHLRWLIGAYYMDSKFFRDQELFAFGNSIGDDYGQTLKSYALFGHIDIKPTEKLTIGLGARESWDKKNFENRTTNIFAKKSWKKFMYDVSANYKLTPDHMIYARYARGSRPGGFNQSAVFFNPETVDSYETGVKTSWLDRKLTLNLTGFYYKYKGIQRQTSVAFDDDNDGVTDRFARVTANAGASHAYGAELELVARPAENLHINFGLGYLDAKYDRWDDFEVIGGVPTPIDNSTLPVYVAPKWTISAGISYDIPVSETGFISRITPSVNIHHKSSHYTITEAQPISYENGYSLLSAALRLEGPEKAYALTFFGDNLFDEYYIQNGGTLGGLSKYVQEGRPRTYGVRLEFQFR